MLHANNSSCCTRSPVCCQVASCCRACLACLTYQHIPGLVRWTDLNIRTWLCQDLSSVSTMPKLLYQEQISALEAATRLNRLVKKETSPGNCLCAAAVLTSVTDIMPSCSFADAWVTCGKGTCLCGFGHWHWAALHRQGWLERPEGPSRSTLNNT